MQQNNNHRIMLRQVYCTLQIEGVHYWKDCPIVEVEYLKYPHRHTFHIKAVVNVSHNDRDVEFIVLKHAIERYLMDTYYDYGLRMCNFEGRSCEMIAEELIDKFDLCECTVSEDNECGSTVQVITK